jgi:DNA-binding NarL/FixJ family response regulator
VRISGREREVLLLIVRGYQYKQAAKELGIATRTVHAHVQSIKRKAGISGPPTRLVRWYYEEYKPAA